MFSRDHSRVFYRFIIYRILDSWKDRRFSHFQNGLRLERKRGEDYKRTLAVLLFHNRQRIAIFKIIQCRIPSSPAIIFCLLKITLKWGWASAGFQVQWCMWTNAPTNVWRIWQKSKVLGSNFKTKWEIKAPVRSSVKLKPKTISTSLGPKPVKAILMSSDVHALIFRFGWGIYIFIWFYPTSFSNPLFVLGGLRGWGRYKIPRLVAELTWPVAPSQKIWERVPST